LEARLASADAAFLKESQSRLELGQQKYGALKFLSVDTLQEAKDEVADLANYARLTWIKLDLLQKELDKIAQSRGDRDSGNFVPMKEFLGGT
jgi:hypothetical protein